MPVVFGSVLLLGVPSAVSNLLVGLTNTISNHILIGHGAGTVAAVGVGGKASMIVTMVVMGICIGVQPVIAYNYGAGDEKRTKEALYKTGILALSVGINFLFKIISCMAGTTTNISWTSGGLRIMRHCPITECWE